MSGSAVVYCVDGARTPFLKYRGQTGPATATELALASVKPLLLRQPFSAKQIDEVIAGCVIPGADEVNIASVIANRMGAGHEIPAYTVQRNCASGMQAIDSAVKDIQLGRSDLVLAGGVEAMSYAPLLYPHPYSNWLSQLARQKSLLAKLKSISQFKLSFLKPIIGLMQGLTDPTCGYLMGQTAEELAYQYDITREAMDAFAMKSHQKGAKAQQDRIEQGIEPLFASNGKVYEHDDGVRADSNLEGLAKLRPFFDKPYGVVTPGNSSQITDGAAFVILASERAVEQHGLMPYAKISAVNWSALCPKVMGLGPAYAIAALLKEQQMSLSDVDYFEINEAFAVQVMAVVQALEQQSHFGERIELDQPVGKINDKQLNIYGGAIALGHPVGASGARLVLNMMHTLKNRNAKRGIASLCIGGGQGGAMLIEAV